jgi:outer membrane protein TolC
MESILAEIESRNTSLLAFRQSIEAEKTGYKTGLMPVNPELGFNYLWNQAQPIGNRQDFSIIQSFDFPSAYVYRHQISGMKTEQAETEYRHKKREILNQARLLIVEILYQNALQFEYTKRKSNARQLADAYERKRTAGETGILELNRARIHLLNLTKELEGIEIERSSLLSGLARLNGGQPIELNDRDLQAPPIPGLFDEWYAGAEDNNPFLQWQEQEVAIAQKREQLQLARNLPGFYAGYMSEKVVGEHFQGISLGVSIPLWESRNTVQYAKAKTIAAQGLQEDARLQYYNEKKALHSRALALRESADTYRDELKRFSNEELLALALDKGEISLAEYLLALTLQYESIDQWLEMERAANKAYIALIH